MQQKLRKGIEREQERESINNNYESIRVKERELLLEIEAGRGQLRQRDSEIQSLKEKLRQLEIQIRHLEQEATTAKD